MDLKGLGYLVSSASVAKLGVVAMPGPGDPPWHGPLVLAGMVASVLGMGLRFRSHRQDRREIETAKREAEER